MIAYNSKSWVDIVFRWRGSVLPGLIPRIAIAAGIGAVAELLYRASAFKIPALGHTLIGVALGLLLVFRTNASYDRFWEGRRLLGGFANRTRDLMRQIVAFTDGNDATAAKEREELQRLVVLLYRLTAQSLRDERSLDSVSDLLGSGERSALESVVNRPAIVASWITHRLVQEARRTGTPEQRLLAMDANLTALIDTWGGCERIRRTPVPLAYAQHIKVFVSLWCFSVPFALVDAMRLYTPFAAALLALALFGIDEIGVEIEDPFGYDANDLPVDAIGEGIRVAAEEIVRVGRPAN